MPYSIPSIVLYNRITLFIAVYNLSGFSSREYHLFSVILNRLLEGRSEAEDKAVAGHSPCLDGSDVSAAY